VGGPDQNDVYPDVRNDYKTSEVAVDYNAGLTGGAAGLAYSLARGDLAACGAGKEGRLGLALLSWLVNWSIS